jgi:hypothetical protein
LNREERIDHVARVILHKAGRPYGWNSCLFSEYEREAWRVVARAAIQAWEETANPPDRCGCKMKAFLIAGILAFLLSLSGCTILRPYGRDQLGIYDQCVEAEGYGLTSFNQFGPTNLGWIRWKRNQVCDETLRIRERGIYAKPPATPIIK